MVWSIGGWERVYNHPQPQLDEWDDYYFVPAWWERVIDTPEVPAHCICCGEESHDPFEDFEAVDWYTEEGDGGIDWYCVPCFILCVWGEEDGQSGGDA